MFELSIRLLKFIVVFFVFDCLRVCLHFLNDFLNCFYDFFDRILNTFFNFQVFKLNLCKNVNIA